MDGLFFHSPFITFLNAALAPLSVVPGFDLDFTDMSKLCVCFLILPDLLPLEFVDFVDELAELAVEAADVRLSSSISSLGYRLVFVMTPCSLTSSSRSSSLTSTGSPKCSKNSSSGVLLPSLCCSGSDCHSSGSLDLCDVLLSDLTLVVLLPVDPDTLMPP